MVDENEKKNLKIIRNNVFPVKLILAVVLIVIICIVGFRMIFVSSEEQSKKEIITKSTLEKIINISELSTFEATYNGVAKKISEDKPDKIDYYVSYEAKVKAGINFEEVEINVDNESKKIEVVLPEIEINDIIVDIASLDYIFENDKANTETVSEEAYKLSIQDVESESSSEDAIYQFAKENAVNIIKALIDPFVKQLDAEYVLEIR